MMTFSRQGALALLLLTPLASLGRATPQGDPPGPGPLATYRIDPLTVLVPKKCPRPLAETVRIHLDGVPVLPANAPRPVLVGPYSASDPTRMRKPPGMYRLKVHPASDPLLKALLLDMVIQYDPDRTLPILELYDEPQNPGPPIGSDLGAALRIDTGAAVFTIPKGEGSLFGEGWLASQVLGTSAFSGLRAVDELGQIFSSTVGTADVQFMVNNDVYAEVAISGDLSMPGQGTPFAAYEIILSSYTTLRELHGEVWIEWPEGALGSLELETGLLQSALFSTVQVDEQDLVAMYDSTQLFGFAMRRREPSPDWTFDLLGLAGGGMRLDAMLASTPSVSVQKVSEFTIEMFDTVPSEWDDVAQRYPLVATRID